MTQNIENIIQTDNQARDIVKKARAKREQIMQDANAERERLVKAGEEKLNILKNRLDRDNETFRENLSVTNATILKEKKDRLSETYSKNETKWVNDIFIRLTETN